MKVNEAITCLWQNGFFETQRPAKVVNSKLQKAYGIHPTNISMNLKSCKTFLNKEKKGWVQRRRYLSSSSISELPKEPELHTIVSDESLIKACINNYDSGNYWDAVFTALRHMEVRVRKKSELPPSEFGADLMEKAFKPSVGPLKIPSCATLGEEDGFKFITKGMMMFHRNAKGHREETIDKMLALKIIGYVDYLLWTIETAEKR